MAEQVISVRGKFNIEFPLAKGHDYKMDMTGEIVEIKDGTGATGQDVYTYVFKPLYGEVMNDKGKTVKVIKKGSQSQKLRADILYRGLDYEKTMTWLIRNLDEILEQWTL